MTDPADTCPVLVLGATGLQGGAVMQALLAANVPVRALVRNAEKANALTDVGVTLAVGTFEDRASLAAACVGACAVFSMQGAPYADKDSERVAGRNIVDAALEAGVPQMIHTSVSGAGAYHRTVPEWGTRRWAENYWESKAYVEDAVRNAGFAFYTILKPAFMMENFTQPKAEKLFPDLVNDRLPTALLPGTKLAYVSALDVGRAAVAAITDPRRFNGAEIELAGDARTMAETAAILSAATGRTITATFLPPAEVAALGQFKGWVITQEWLNVAGYPATPAHARLFDLDPIDLPTWAQEKAAAIA